MASGLFNSVVSMGRTAMQRFQADFDPYLVRTVNTKDYGTVVTQERHECLLFCGPKKIKKEEDVYEVIVLSVKNDTAFCILRSTDVSEARATFNVFRDKIPPMLEIDPNLCTLGALQQVSDSMRKNPSYSLSHLAVELDFRKVMAEKSVLDLKETPDGNGMTPLMLAVQKENMFMIQLLMGKSVTREVKDKRKNTVYHYAAVTTKNIIETLSPEGTPDCPALNVCNDDGNTPLHIACKNDKPECVQALLIAGADVNVTGTHDKEYPIHSALKSSSARCVKEIVKMYPKQLHTQDIKNGGTPLHWAKEKEIIEALAGSGCQLETKDFNGDTALHVMARHERVDCVIGLICAGALIDARGGKGNTALHIAVKLASVAMVKALLVFEADTAAKNEEGLTPWQLAKKKWDASGVMDVMKDREGVLFAMHAVGAEGVDREPVLDKSGEELSFKKYRAALVVHQKRVRTCFDEVLANKAKRIKIKGSLSRKGSVVSNEGATDPALSSGRLLSLDGGGVKGLVLTRMLLSMEKVWGVPTSHCFDWICGTSTGGMLALALASGKSIMDCQYLYMRLKDKVFVGSKPYSTKPMEELLKNEFGDLKMYQLKDTKVFVTATMADRSPPDLYLFRNYPSPQSQLGIANYDHPELSEKRKSPTHQSEQLVWKAARASGAAPSFFRPETNFVDGGILANNPSLALLTEIAEFNVAKKALDHDEEVVRPYVMLSLGTGVPPVKKTNVVDIFRPDNVQDTLKMVMNWDSMGKLMLDSVLDADGLVVDHTRAWCLSSGISFHRLAPNLPFDMELDETDDKILVELMWSTMAYMHSRKDDVLALKELLLI